MKTPRDLKFNSTSKFDLYRHENYIEQRINAEEEAEAKDEIKMLRGRTNINLKAIAEDDADSKRTSISKHGYIRAKALEWLNSETEIRKEMEEILMEQRRVKEGRRQALWKSWVYHMAAPMRNAIANYLDSPMAAESAKQKRNLHKKYIEYSNNPLNVLSLGFVNYDKYNPFLLRHLDKISIPVLVDPLMMKWRDREEEKSFIKSSWPLENLSSQSSANISRYYKFHQDSVHSSETVLTNKIK